MLGRALRTNETLLDFCENMNLDNNLSYKGLICTIQKPNIKFSNRAISSLKDTSPNSHFFPSKKIIQKIWTVGSAKIGQPMAIPENGP